MAISEDGFYRLTEEEYSDLLEKLEFLTEENKKLSIQKIHEEHIRETRRIQELDQFREAIKTWWKNIDHVMRLYDTQLGNEHRLRHERQKLLREIEELRKQVGIVAVYDGPKKDDKEKTEAG